MSQSEFVKKLMDGIASLQEDDDAPSYPPPKYARLLAAIREFALDTLKSGGEVPATAHIMKENKRLDVVVSKFTNLEEKNFFAQTIRQRASRIEADAVVFLSETWALRMDKKTGLSDEDFKKYRQADKYPDLGDHPDRMDTLMIQLETYDGQWMGMSEIVPAKKGRKIGPIAWTPKALKSSGRFANFLPVIYLTPQEADDAVKLMRNLFRAEHMDPDHRMPSGTTIIGLFEQIIRQSPKKRVTEERMKFIVKVLSNFYPGPRA